MGNGYHVPSVGMGFDMGMVVVTAVLVGAQLVWQFLNDGLTSVWDGDEQP